MKVIIEKIANNIVLLGFIALAVLLVISSTRVNNLKNLVDFHVETTNRLLHENDSLRSLGVDTLNIVRIDTIFIDKIVSMPREVIGIFCDDWKHEYAYIVDGYLAQGLVCEQGERNVKTIY